MGSVGHQYQARGMSNTPLVSEDPVAFTNGLNEDRYFLAYQAESA